MLNFSFLIRLLTTAYALVIAFIVWCASAGWYGPTFTWVQTYVGDKWLHFVLVGTMALLLNLSLNLTAISQRFRWILWGTGIMLTLATLEEVSQYWFSTRTFDLGDLTCNYLGILVIGQLPFLFTKPEKSQSVKPNSDLPDET